MKINFILAASLLMLTSEVTAISDSGLAGLIKSGGTFVMATAGFIGGHRLGEIAEETVGPNVAGVFGLVGAAAALHALSGPLSASNTVTEALHSIPPVITNGLCLAGVLYATRLAIGGALGLNDQDVWKAYRRVGIGIGTTVIAYHAGNFFFGWH